MAARRTSPAREVEAVAEKLHSAALLLLRRLRTEGDARGISPPRLAALSVVVDTGPIGIGSLAAAEGVSAPTMSRLVDGLELDGLVRRTTDPDDARGVLVRATVRGRRIRTEGRRHRIRILATDLQRLSREELEAIRVGAELIERVGAGRKAQGRSGRPG
jgi:DNA-binding MarR family transcriptional regulator